MRRASICVHASCAVAHAHSLKITALTVGRRPKSHRRRRERNLGRHLQWSCCRRCRRCSPSHHLLPVCMSIPMASSLFEQLASLEEMSSQALKAPRRSHHRQLVSPSASKARVQTALLATLEMEAIRMRRLHARLTMLAQQAWHGNWRRTSRRVVEVAARFVSNTQSCECRSNCRCNAYGHSTLWAKQSVVLDGAIVLQSDELQRQGSAMIAASCSPTCLVWSMSPG